MKTLQTAILIHSRPQDTHADWLLESPDPGAAGLITFRMAMPVDWRIGARWVLTPLPAHRRRYLSYQGPVSNRRGLVRRFDAGLHRPEIVNEWVIQTVIETPKLYARAELRRVAQDRWVGVLGAP